MDYRVYDLAVWVLWAFVCFLGGLLLSLGWWLAAALLHWPLPLDAPWIWPIGSSLAFGVTAPRVAAALAGRSASGRPSGREHQAHRLLVAWGLGREEVERVLAHSQAPAVLSAIYRLSSPRQNEAAWRIELDQFFASQIVPILVTPQSGCSPTPRLQHHVTDLAT